MWKPKRLTQLAEPSHFKIRLGRSRLSWISPVTALRCYATQNGSASSPNVSRKQVTVVGDDGRVQWQDLSGREKVARTTQQTFNFGLILTGIFMTVSFLMRNYVEHQLRQDRAALCIFCTRKSSPRTAKPVTSTVPSIESAPTRKLWSYLDPATRFELLGSRRLTNGQEQGQLLRRCAKTVQERSIC